MDNIRLSKPRVVIVGGGFGGLSAAKGLKNANADVILIDRNNHHLFQPLLYQVAVSALSPGDIAAPIRTILRGQKNIQVHMGEVQRIDLPSRKIILGDGELNYDYLILAPGSQPSYFNHDEWKSLAPGLKDLKDALEIRRIVISAFERAERTYGTDEFHKYTTFVIVGGGPTGVELAGAISEIARKTLLPDYPILKSDDIKVYLVEGGSRLMKAFREGLSGYTLKALQNLDVNVMLNHYVKDIKNGSVDLGDIKLDTENVIWAAGNSASPLMGSLNLKLDSVGRVEVENDLNIPGHENVFIIGDCAALKDKNGGLLPGIAPVAIQEGKYVAKLIKERTPKAKRKPFVYFDRGNMATIGKAKAIAEIAGFGFKGLFAWLMWGFIHIMYLIDFRNRVSVMLEWIWYYITYKPGALLLFSKEKEKN